MSGQCDVWHGLPRAAGPVETPALYRGGVGGAGLGLGAEARLLGPRLPIQNRARGGTTGEAKVPSVLWTSLIPFSNFILSILLKKLM